jgi:hypothetical protein
MKRNFYLALTAIRPFLDMDAKEFAYLAFADSDVKDHLADKIQTYRNRRSNGSDPYILIDLYQSLDTEHQIMFDQWFETELEKVNSKTIPYESEEDKEYVDVVVRIEIKGHFLHGYTKRYTRGRESAAFTLDQFARIIFIYERLLNAGSTYAMDGMLQEVEKHLPKKDGETAQQVFEKYWINMKDTINSEYEEFNAGQSGEFIMYPEKDDYLKSCFMSLANSVLKSAKPIQDAFIYWAHKYCYNSSFDEIQKDLDAVPEHIKGIVDALVAENAEATSKRLADEL